MVADHSNQRSNRPLLHTKYKMYTPDRIDNSILNQERFYHAKSLNVEI